MSNITSYLVSYNGNPVAIINAESDTQLKEKLSQAIKEEVGTDADTQFSLSIGKIGQWGEDTKIKTSYVVDGSLIDDDEFVIRTLVSY